MRQGKKIAQLAPRTRNYIEGGLAKAHRLVVVKDEEGEPVGRRRESVREGDNPVVLTVVTIEAVDVYGDSAVLGRSLTMDDARACGVRTLQSLRDAWRAQYPRSDFAQLVWFLLGDHRDRDVFLNFTSRAGGDYTFNSRRAMDPDAPALSPEQYAHLGMAARQRDARRTIDHEKVMATFGDAERMARIERMGEEMRVRFSKDLRVINDRLGRIEQRESSRGIVDR